MHILLEVAHSHGKAGFTRRLDGVLFLLDTPFFQYKSPHRAKEEDRKNQCQRLIPRSPDELVLV